MDHLMSHVKASPPLTLTSTLGGDAIGLDKPADELLGAAPGYECPHCRIKVATEGLFYAHLVQHSQLAALQVPTMAFPSPFFFLGHNAAGSSNSNK